MTNTDISMSDKMENRTINPKFCPLEKDNTQKGKCHTWIDGICSCYDDCTMAAQIGDVHDVRR